MVLLRREPLLYLEFNKPNKQNVFEINLFKKSTFPSVKKTVDTLIDVSNKIKTSLLKIGKIKYIALLSDANVPVRFRAQQRDKYS